MSSPRDPSFGQQPRSAYYGYQTAAPPSSAALPRPAGPHSGQGQEDSRYGSHLHSGPTSLASRDPHYSLSTSVGMDRTTSNQHRSSYPSQPSPEHRPGGVEQRRLSLAPPLPGTSYGPSTPPAGIHARSLRVIDEQYITGEGICYVYEDGSRVQKFIDGENVNPQWGVTKAGKPRKRLAQACTTCREKKIKCDPNSPKCIQCQKFNRECRFENAYVFPLGMPVEKANSSRPRGHHHMSQNFAPNMAKPGSQEPRISPSQDGVNRATLKRPADDGYSLSLAKRPASEVQQDLKKPRRGSASSISPEPDREDSKRFKGKSSAFPPLSSSRIPEHEMGQSTIAVDWHNDPWDLDAESANYHLNLYFDHVNAATYCMFPRTAFTKWCQTHKSKTPEDKMLVYSLLAMGAVFSARPAKKNTLRKLQNVADHAVQSTFGKFTIQLAQSRLILALLHFSLGNSTRAWDYSGGAVRVICGLKLNIEEGVVENAREEENIEYGLTKAGFEECQRRTFWSAVIMDRFNGFCSGHVSLIHPEDIFLRLPMAESAYEAQEELSTPLFNNGFVDPSLCIPNSSSVLGSMAHLINISCIWHDTLAFIYRSVHNYQQSASATVRYETHHKSIMTRLHDWNASLPNHLTWSQSNLHTSIRLGYVGTFLSIHSLYHCSAMKLNRHLRWEILSPEAATRNIHLATHHAKAYLFAIHSLARIDRGRRRHRLSTSLSGISTSPSASPFSTAPSSSNELAFTFSTPFTGYAILTAVDILTSCGPLDSLSELITLVDNGLEIIEELGDFWNSAAVQFRLVQGRQQELVRLLEAVAMRSPGSIDQLSPSSNSMAPKLSISPTRLTTFDGRRAWITQESLMYAFGKSIDMIYSMPRTEFLRALGIDIKDERRDCAYVDGRGQERTPVQIGDYV